MIRNLLNILLISLPLAGMLRPEPGAELSYVHVLFEWEQEPDAVGYNLQISDFDSVIVDVNVSSTVYIETSAIEWSREYSWRVRPTYSSGEDGDWSDFRFFSTGNKKFQSLQTTLYNEDLLSDGLVAFGGFAPDLESGIIDRYGNEIWNDGQSLFILSHINESGNIYGLSGVDYPYNSGTKVNTDMDFVWSNMSNDVVDIHEIKQIPNGNYMAFLREYRQGPIPPDNYMTEYFQSLGFAADGITPELDWYGQKIVEWNEDREIVWSWSPFDHFTMDDYDNYGPTWYDAFFSGQFEYDWMHSNAFHFDEEESVIYVSHRHLSRITKISYPSGEVLWNMGLPSEYMSSGDDHICSDLLFSFQHNIQLLDDGSLLFFDNGNLSEMLLGDTAPRTRIRRVNVIEDSSCEVVWQYDLPLNLHGMGMGSVQLLDNGNYLIYTFGNGLNQAECTVMEVTSQEEILWKTVANPNVAWYRSYKIPSLHPDAFSILADRYTRMEQISAIESSATDGIGFNLSNKSGYSQTYRYIFYEMIEGGGYSFSPSEGTIDLGPYESAALSFPYNQGSNDLELSRVSLTVWPTGHEYATKELEFDVVIQQVIEGDINADGMVNILDIVQLIAVVLDGAFASVADINGDGFVNILDAVQLINIILEV